MKVFTCDTCGSDFSVERIYGVPPKRCSEECKKAHRKKAYREYRKDNKEAISRRMKKWRQENAESLKEYHANYYRSNLDYFKSKKREWSMDNAEYVSEYNHRWYRENTDIAKAASKRWRINNPSKVRSYQHDRRALKRDAWVENVNPRVLLERSGWVCGICKEEIPKDAVYGSPLYATVDHVIPLSKGGEHSYANTQPAHFSCNSRKRAKIDGWEGMPAPTADSTSMANAGRGES